MYCVNLSIVQEEIEYLIEKPTYKQMKKFRQNAIIHSILSEPSVKLKRAHYQFQFQGEKPFREYCFFGTKQECARVRKHPCGNIHFRKLQFPHTDLSLGDCSYLDTCRHMNTCKYVHYTVDEEDAMTVPQITLPQYSIGLKIKPKIPAQWINCDIRKLDLSILGKFSVIMADPPWDIHMELPYGTLTDDEMKSLNISVLQDDGLLFLWVTGRAMELGRECMQLWGYKMVQEIVWVKINQLQRIIRTGRTGHWINHSKEHCLVGIKGNPKLNARLDCDVIVSEVRETSRKPDEIYAMIERLSPGTRKLELFGRPHNIHDGWLTLGNQLDGVAIVEEDVKRRYEEYVKKQQQQQQQ